jgi:hypothetical protein
MSTGGSGTWLLRDTKRADLEAAWREREAEAANLKSAGYELMSIGLRVYALEIKVKVVICKTLVLDSLPKHCKTHDLDELIVFTGLFSELADPANVGLKENWDRLADFSRNHLNNLRYFPSSKLADPASRLNASLLADLIVALDDPQEGVGQWLSKRL